MMPKFPWLRPLQGWLFLAETIPGVSPTGGLNRPAIGSCDAFSSEDLCPADFRLGHGFFRHPNRLAQSLWLDLSLSGPPQFSHV